MSVNLENKICTLFYIHKKKILEFVKIFDFWLSMNLQASGLHNLTNFEKCLCALTQELMRKIS